MTPALIVFVVLGIILMLISMLIWKSSMPENDKILSLIMILAVFSLVAIINEVKRAQSTTKPLGPDNQPSIIPKQEAKSLEREFFSLTLDNPSEFLNIPVDHEQVTLFFSAV